MSNKNMTALVSCFARCYHYKNNKYRIFNDNIAEKILSKEEYDLITKNMTAGINFFNSKFEGTKEEALKWIVDNQLSPSVLGRNAFCENALKTAVKIGCKQYLIFASGYDTFAYRNNFVNLSVYEIDRHEMIEDKIRRLNASSINYNNVKFIECDFTKDNWIDNVIASEYDCNVLSFNSLLGISYYLTKEEFSNMIKCIANIICNGNSILFDYPTYDKSKEMFNNDKLASGANEKMKSKYYYEEIENILSQCGLLIYEHLDDKEMTNHYLDIIY